MNNTQKGILAVLVAIMAFAGGFAGSYFWQGQNGKETAKQVATEIVKAGDNKSNTTLTPLNSVRTMPNKSGYFTFIVTYKTDSTVSGIQSNNDNSYTQKITGTGPSYTFASSEPALNDEDQSVTYRAIVPSTLGFYEDTLFGHDTITNSTVTFKLGDVVRIVRGPSPGNVVFGVVSLENTSTLLLKSNSKQ